MKGVIYFIGFLCTVFSSQSIWITFAPVASLIAEEQNVSSTYVGLLAVLYPVFFLVLSFPAGRLIDQRPRPYLLIASALTALGALGRFTADSLWVWYVCQSLAAVAQPFILNAFVPVANTLFPEKRGLALSAMSMSMYGGMAFSLFSGTYLYENFGLAGLFLPSAIASSLGLCLMIFGEKTVLPTSKRGDTSEVLQLKEMFTSKEILLLGAILGLGVGTFDNLSTWLEPALKGTQTARHAGSFMGGAIVAGIFSVAVLMPFISRRGLHIEFLKWATIIISASMLVLSILPAHVLIGAILIAGGAVMFPAYPVILELIAMRFKNPGVATGAVGMVSRVVTVVLTISAAFFIKDAHVFFRFLAVPVLVGFVLVLFFRKK